MSHTHVTKRRPEQAPRSSGIAELATTTVKGSFRSRNITRLVRMVTVAALLSTVSCSFEQVTLPQAEGTSIADDRSPTEISSDDPSSDPADVVELAATVPGSATKSTEPAFDVTDNQVQQQAPSSTPQQEGISTLPVLQDKTFDAAIRDIVVREDPIVDGWDTEFLTERTIKQLNQIGQFLESGDEIDTSLASESFRSSELRPRNLQVIYKSPGFVIRRPRGKVELLGGSGTPTFVAALRQIEELLRGAADIHYKFKIIRAAHRGQMARTRAFAEFSGVAGKERRQINATWDCEWQLPLDRSAGPPLLNGIKMLAYEEVACRSSSGGLFSDCTRSALQHLPALESQLIHGRDHWYGNLEATIGVEGRGNGIAIGDVNGDLLEDIYICQPASLPNRLFVRQADGSLEDVSAAANVDWLDSTRAALLVDLDNDGDQDLVMTHSTTLVIQENDGTGRFAVRRLIHTDSRLFSLNAIDVDNDRRLDLYVCGYSSAAQTRPEDVFVSPVPYHDANNGGPNFLFRNVGDWVFQDVTERVGLDTNNLRFSLASAWDDFDNDGDLDLYVANDFGRNNLYRNDDGTFVDIAGNLDVEDIGPGMSATWNDYNNDGYVDLYVSNMFSSAGSRITHNPKFKPDAAHDDLLGFRRHARGNSLFKNLSGKGFSDQSLSAGVTMGRWAWGSLLTDINNDGWRDVYVTNGFVTADNNNDL